MPTALLADLVLLLHVGVVLFVVAGLPLWVATAHNAGAALLLFTVVGLLARLRAALRHQLEHLPLAVVPSYQARGRRKLRVGDLPQRLPHELAAGAPPAGR